MRKLLAILGVITCMIGLCACGQEATQASLNEEGLITNGEALVDWISQTVGQGEIEPNAVDSVLYDGLLSWQSSLSDIGQYNGTAGGTVSVSGDEIVVDINVLGSEHNAVVEFVVDSSDFSTISITTNVEYSFGEIITKAVMNTLIGMGTVFVVLIFISLIISCFGLFSKVDTKKKSTEAAPSSSAVAVEPVVAQAVEEEELTDDTELVAVIAAAIAAYEGSGSTDGFVVRSIRKSNKSKWQNA